MVQERNRRSPSTASRSESMKHEAGLDPKRIREQIEETRARLSGTLGALEDQVRPDRLRQKATVAVRDAVEHRIQRAVTAAANLPMAGGLALAALGWWFRRDRRGWRPIDRRPPLIRSHNRSVQVPTSLLVVGALASRFLLTRARSWASTGRPTDVTPTEDRQRPMTCRGRTIAYVNANRATHRLLKRVAVASHRLRSWVEHATGPHA